MPSEEMEAKAYQIGQDAVVRLEREFSDVPMEDFVELVEGALEPMMERFQIAKEEAGRD
jgi:hypothetical protein